MNAGAGTLNVATVTGLPESPTSLSASRMLAFAGGMNVFGTWMAMGSGSARKKSSTLAALPPSDVLKNSYNFDRGANDSPVAAGGSGLAVATATGTSRWPETPYGVTRCTST